MKDLQEFIKKDGARRRVSGGDGRKGKKSNEEGYIDLRNEEQMQTLEQKYKGTGNGKAYEYLQEVKILGNIGINADGAILNSEAITALGAEGKLAEFKRIVGLLPEETQAIYAPMIEGYEFANRVGWNKKGKTDHLKTALSRITGIDDVSNLGWKLAAVLQDWAPIRLLDSYEIERKPIGIRNTAASGDYANKIGSLEFSDFVDEDSERGLLELSLIHI